MAVAVFRYLDLLRWRAAVQIVLFAAGSLGYRLMVLGTLELF